MTLIIAIKCKDACIIASDGRIVRADEYRSEEKIFKIGNKVIIGLAGSSGVIKRIVNSLRGVVSNIKSDECVMKIESILAEIYKRHQEIYGGNFRSKEEFDRQFYGNLLAIDDENIYAFFFDGYPEPCGNFEAIGSASGYVRTLLETFYEKNMDVNRAKELAVYCVLQAMKVSRDIGEPIQIGVVTKEGEGEILNSSEVQEIINKINGRERILHDVWNLLSKEPETQKDLENLIKKRLYSLE
jgi:20S proteasome alpha/beta subunit